MGQRLTPREQALLQDTQALIETAETLNKSAPQKAIVTPGLERKEGQRGRYMTERFQHVLQTFEPENTDTFFQQCRTESSFRKQAVHSSFFEDTKRNESTNLIFIAYKVKELDALFDKHDKAYLKTHFDLIGFLKKLLTNEPHKTHQVSNILKKHEINILDFATSREFCSLLFTEIRHVLTPLEKVLLMCKYNPNKTKLRQRQFNAMCKRNRLTPEMYLLSLAEQAPNAKQLILKELSEFLSTKYQRAINALHSNTKDSGSREQVVGRRP